MYLDIVDEFKTIDDVYFGKDYSTGMYHVRVRGTNENGFHDHYRRYMHRKVAEEVAKRISDFIGV